MAVFTIEQAPLGSESAWILCQQVQGIAYPVAEFHTWSEADIALDYAERGVLKGWLA